MSNLELRNQLFKKVSLRMKALGIGQSDALGDCSELNPDVIVIPDDHSLIFEVRNWRALEVMARICGFALDTLTLSERIRVHCSRSRQIIKQLMEAGATVSGEV